MSERLNTQDLIDLLIKRQGLEKKEAENFVKEFFALIEEGLEKDRFVKIKGLGTFKLVDVENRESVNVNTGERIEIQGHTKISFVPDSSLRDIINKPFAHFETVILNDGVDLNDETDLNLPEENSTEQLTPIQEPAVVEEPEENEAEKDIEEQPEEEVIETPAPAEPEAHQTIEVAPPLESPDTPEEEKTPQKKEPSQNNKILVIVVILTTLLCGAILFSIYYSDLFPEKKKGLPIVEQKEEPIDNNVVNDTIASPDSLETKTPENNKTSEKAKEDLTTSTSSNSNSSTAKNSRIPFSQIPVNADSTSYNIVGTKTHHTIREGESLIRISYRYYKTKDLWPYLLIHNRSKIKDPNALPLGMKIDIPELKRK